MFNGCELHELDFHLNYLRDQAIVLICVGHCKHPRKSPPPQKKKNKKNTPPPPKKKKKKKNISDLLYDQQFPNCRSVFKTNGTKYPQNDTGTLLGQMLK